MRTPLSQDNTPLASLSPSEKAHVRTIAALLHLPPIEQVIKKPVGTATRIIKQIKDFLGL